MSAERFFIEHPPDGPAATLGGAEAHHLRHVRRVTVDDEVVLFDGSGTDYVARVEAFDRAGVALQILRAEPSGREPDIAVTLAVALVKPQAIARLIDMGTQLGMRRLIPVQTERSAGRPGPGRPGRWRRIAIEACKQCGRSVIPEIVPLVDLDAVLRQADDHDVAVIGSMADDARPLGQVLSPSARSVLCLVGPEGGFTDAEEAAARGAGYLPVSLSKSILRTETAAAAALAQVLGAAPM